MKKKVRQFVLYQPILTKDGAVRLPALIPTYGIFCFDEKDLLFEIYTYDLDGRKAKLSFADVKNVTEEIPFPSLVEIEEEINRLRKVELILPKLSPNPDTPFNNLFSNQALLLTQFRILVQFRIVLTLLGEETE